MSEADQRESAGNRLVRAHDRLRRHLAELQTGTGRAFPEHCSTFCAALTVHHTVEDDDVFAALVADRPDLAPTVEKLREDHGSISGLLHRVQEAARKDGDAARRELDGLAAIMESHFRFEERTVRAALDELDAVPPLLPEGY